MRRAVSIFASQYQEDLRMTKLLAAASAIALCIASSGIYVLSAYNVRRKEREIVLRKLLRAMPRQIAALVLRDNIGAMAAGGLISLPLAFFAAQRYLAGFIEHAPMVLGALPLALIIVSLLALLASLRHARLALKMVPTQALRGD
jgi:putative ABC transport system permease protein